MITKTRSARGKTQCRFDLAEYTFAPESWFCIRTDHVLLVLFRFVARFIFANKREIVEVVQFITPRREQWLLSH